MTTCAKMTDLNTLKAKFRKDSIKVGYILTAIQVDESLGSGCAAAY